MVFYLLVQLLRQSANSCTAQQWVSMIVASPRLQDYSIAIRSAGLLRRKEPQRESFTVLIACTPDQSGGWSGVIGCDHGSY